MAIDLTPGQRELGKQNFARAAEGLTRRGFMKSLAAGAAVIPVSAAVYFGYQSLGGKPVKAALIGAGDEGGVLVGEHNPEFLEFVAVCDIRPTSLHRIFAGDPRPSLRKGLNKVYGSSATRIKKYTDYRKLLCDEKEIEAVVIALPLHLHAPVAVACMRAGLERGKPIHVLCEKLMAWNIAQCKKMIRVAKETKSILTIGHQRHYSMLYAHAAEVIKAGVLGDIKHIRALWHRNNSWPWEPDSAALAAYGPLAQGVPQPYYRDSWFNPIYARDNDELKGRIEQYGYDSVEQLIRWRLYNATGGGLMAELGSHQLDACSIFLGKVHPLAVTAVGSKSYFGKGRHYRDCQDQVFVTYEFPGSSHPRGPVSEDGSRGSSEDDVVVVTYSSLNTNSFERYGECLMGSRGTMVVEGEASLMLYPEPDPNKKQGSLRATAVTISSIAIDTPILDSTGTSGSAQSPSPPGPAGTNGIPVSRGYREEMEDFAYCIRMWDQAMEKDRRLPRCHGEVAMADAIVALAANHSMNAKNRERITFKDTWFDYTSDEVPDEASVKPKVDVP